MQQNQIQRLQNGPLNDSKTFKFSFDNHSYEGLEGDTVSSALLANGVKVVGRSFKYHRPRGIFTADVSEPNALVERVWKEGSEPNTNASVSELSDNTVINSQNYLGSLNFDLLAVNDFIHPLISAGFYYKTFMWPASFWEKYYEVAIRRAAGIGKLDPDSQPLVANSGYLHCDVLIIGSGAAGISAALATAKSGAKVILAEQDFVTGGSLQSESYLIGDKPASKWADDTIEYLEAIDNLRIMKRTTVFGGYDNGIYGAIQKTKPVGGNRPNQVYWRIYAKRVILCSGASERSVAFANNDLPGVMLASSVRGYVNRFGVAPGNKIAIFTNNNNGLRTAKDLLNSGIEVTAVIDSRENSDAKFSEFPCFNNVTPIKCKGRKGLKEIILSNGETITADCLAVSGGWNPNLHLTSHTGSKPVWDDKISSFVPARDNLPAGMKVAGSSNGTFSLQDCILEGFKAGCDIAKDLGFKPPKAEFPKIESEISSDIKPLWLIKQGSGRKWIDLQNDVTSSDIAQSVSEGFDSPEHLKRYTTLGMGPDQGKTSVIVGMGVLAEIKNTTIDEVGTTVYRPPYTPVSIGALAGSSTGKHFRPTRLPPSHSWAKEQNAVFIEAGNWLRAQWYPKEGETNWIDTVNREVGTVRSKVGVCDVTTLGKIDVKGEDAAVFLSKVYAGNTYKVAKNKVRYGIMLREDGFIYDDGTVAHIDDNHYVITTTTVNAGLVYRNMEFARQCLWPNLKVHLASITDTFAQYTVAGIHARRLLNKLIDGEFDLSNEAFPFMSCAKINICNGIQARIYRISFSGELSYEIAVPWEYGDSLIRTIMEAGAEFGIQPYGTEALGVLRIEKGHPAGAELNGQTTPQSLGFTKMLQRKGDFIGKAMSAREEFNDINSFSLVGLITYNNNEQIIAGSHLFAQNSEFSFEDNLGWVTSVAYSPTKRMWLALAMVKKGNLRKSEILYAFNPLTSSDNIRVKIAEPCFHDPKGELLRE